MDNNIDPSTRAFLLAVTKTRNLSAEDMRMIMEGIDAMREHDRQIQNCVERLRCHRTVEKMESPVENATVNAAFDAWMTTVEMSNTSHRGWMLNSFIAGFKYGTLPKSLEDYRSVVDAFLENHKT